MSALMLLSGVPATGKSSLGRWLEAHHGFAHIDVENGGLNRFGLSPAWRQMYRSRPPDVTAFVEGLRKLGRPVALDWGFPVQRLPIVRALHEAGVTAWWFDGDRAAARLAFLQRGTVSVEALDRQMRGIEVHQPFLDDFYDGRIIRAINAGGSFAPADSIFATLSAIHAPALQHGQTDQGSGT
jgi:hypothetical protein